MYLANRTFDYTKTIEIVYTYIQGEKYSLAELKSSEINKLIDDGYFSPVGGSVKKRKRKVKEVDNGEDSST